MQAIKLNLYGVDWNAPTRTVLDTLTDRYMAAVPDPDYADAVFYAEHVYAGHLHGPYR